jgi:cell division protein ZapE
MVITSLQPARGPEELTLDQIDTSASVEQIVADFVPPPHFAQVSFANYRPDPAHPSQEAALEQVRNFVGKIAPGDRAKPRLFGLLKRSAHPGGRCGIYLDGGYGVGKTHLLASAYQAAPNPKAYLSFQELAYTIGAMGMQPCLEAFSQYRLVCIDEFELDDVGNTMLAKTFITGLTEAHTRIITTSNTLPSDLGHGRFASHDFKREIGQIAAAFEVLQIDGDDFRHRSYKPETLSQGLESGVELRKDFEVYQPTHGAKLYATFEELIDYLAKLHPIRYQRFLAPLEALFIEGLRPMEDQNIALRFVHLIDKLYDQDVHFFASSRCDLPDLFCDEYRDKGYAKKYRRCLSRLHEMLQEK